MDDNGRPVDGEAEPARQVVDFEVTQPQNVLGSQLPPGRQEEAAQPPPDDLPAALEVTEIIRTTGLPGLHSNELPPSEEKDEVHETVHSVEQDQDAEPLSSNPQATLHVTEIRLERPFPDDQVASDKTQGVVPSGLQDLGTQPLLNEPQETPGVPGIKDARLNSDDQVPLDELPPNEKRKIPQESIPSLAQAIQAEEVKTPSSPAEPPRSLPVSPKAGESAENSIPPTTPTSRKSFRRRIDQGIERVFPLEIRKNIPNFPSIPVPFTGKKTDDQTKNVLKKDDQKKDPKRDDEKKDGQKKNQKKVDPNESEAGQKAPGEPKQKEVDKAPASDPWETCKFEIIQTPVPNDLKGLDVDIVAIHDLDETAVTAWTFTPQKLKTSKDNDLGSRRSSTERSTQQLEAQALTSEGAKKRRGSTKDDTSPDFKNREIAQEGRKKMVDGLEPSGADSLAVTEEKHPAAPGTLLSQAGPPNGPPQQGEPPNGVTSVSGPSNGPSRQGGAGNGETGTPGPSNGPSQQDASPNRETTKSEPSTNEPETKATSSGENKKENATPELKGAGRGNKRQGKGVSLNASAAPQAPEATPPKPALLEPGVDSRRESKDGDEGRTSESRQRSGRPSTDVDGSERRRQVHLFRDPNMISGAFPGARILSYTYPSVSSTTAHEYIDKVAEKLLKNLRDERGKLRTNTVPIIFIGSGIGGLVLQKLLVLAVAETGVEKNAETAQIQSMTAGLVFLDTPFPATQQENKADRPSFPLGSNTRQKHIMTRLKASGNKLDLGALWESFDKKRVILGQKLPIVWLYTSIAKDPVYTNIQPKRPMSALAHHGIFCMAMPSESNKRGLSRFSNPKDPVYLMIVSQMYRCLLFQTCKIKKLEDLLSDILTLPTVPNVPVDVEDERGRSALHCAASSSNDAAVAILVGKGKANVGHKDTEGQTPLHAVMRKAAEEDPIEEEAQKPFKDIIIRLMGYSEVIFQVDKARKTAWSYGEKLPWIKKLRNTRGMYLGPSTSDEAQLLEPLTVPQKDTPQRKACQNFLGDLVEFYTVTKEQKTEEKHNFEKPDVLDMIYNLGPKKILDRTRPKLTDEVFHCRWLHFPANNEQWIHDLFIALKIRDISFVDQHEGSKQAILHMIPQATKVKQVCEVYNWGVGRNDGRKVSLVSTRTQIFGDATGPEPATGISMGPTDNEISPADANGNTDKPQAAPQSTTTSDTLALKPVTMDKDAIALFMPILAYETSRARKKVSEAIRTHIEGGTIEEEKYDLLLLPAYLHGNGTKPLHCRRTLDQFSSYMLDSKLIEDRDRNQVIYQWGRKTLRAGDAPVLMVDQLWLWVLHDGTLITSFPNAWDNEQPYSLKHKLDEEIQKNKQRNPISSIDYLVHLIIKLSVDFLRREGPSGIKFQEAFQESINDISERERKQFKCFKDLTKQLNAKGLTEAGKTILIKKLFQLNIETNLLVKIKDIQDELNIVASVLASQYGVLKRLHKLCSTDENAGDDASLPEKSKKKRVLEVGKAADKSEEQPDLLGKPQQKGILHHDNEKEAPLQEKKKEKKQVHFSDGNFKDTEKDTPLLRDHSLVDDNLGIVWGNIQIVQDMQRYADQVHTSINNLLDLKQRQAIAREAQFSREGSQQSQRQGNIMLVFTLVTIVFLPLSFMSSFFALSVKDFPKDNGTVSWPLHTLSFLLFGISTLVFVPLILVAFYVNQITSFTRETLKSFFSRENKSTDTFEEIKEEEDSDEETVEDDDDDIKKGGSNDEYNFDDFSDDDTYAPIFGRWKKFHTRIPILRRLWERQLYPNPNYDDNDDDYSFEMDYPLHHFLSMISLRKLSPSRLSKWWLQRKGYVVEVRGKDSSYFHRPVTQIFEPVEELFRRRDRDDTYTRSDENRASDRDSGSTSGSEGHVSRLGAAFPEPLRRLFVRRRSVDIESAPHD